MNIEDYGSSVEELLVLLTKTHFQHNPIFFPQIIYSSTLLAVPKSIKNKGT